MENYRSAGRGSATHSSSPRQYCIWAWQRTETDGAAEWALRIGRSWSRICTRPRPRREEVLRCQGTVSMGEEGLVDPQLRDEDDARTVPYGSRSTVQNHPGLCPHPPSPDGRRDTKPDPPTRSSDSVEGRRCCPPAPCPLPPASTRNPDMLPSFCLLTVGAFDRRLLDQGWSFVFPQLPAKPAGGSTTTATLDRWHTLPRPTTQSDPIHQTPDNPLPSVRLPGRPSVRHF